MAIRMTITHRMHPPGFPRDSTEKTFDIDLISFNEMEFVDEDLDSMLAFKGFGDTEYDHHLDFYTKYTEEHGFFLFFLSKHMMPFYEALEEQGYKNFNYGNFSKIEMIEYLFGFMKEADTWPINQTSALEALFGVVDFSEEDKGLLSQDKYRQLLLKALRKGWGSASRVIELLNVFYGATDEDGYRIFDEEYAKTLVAALENASRYGTSDVLDELGLYITKDDIDYTSEPIYDYGHYVVGDEAHQNTDAYENKLSVLGQPLYEWKTLLTNEIIDPIGFYSNITDWEDHDKEFSTPEGASDILAHYGIVQIEHEDPAKPDHPISDEDGKFAVCYEGPEEDIIVPYKSEFDIKEAIEMSGRIFANGGEAGEWTMTAMKLIDNEWHDTSVTTWEKNEHGWEEWVTVPATDDKED